MKYLILPILTLGVFFSLTTRVFASIRITEIMYDLPGTDTNREWVEIYNDGISPVDITGWKFFDGSNHNLVAPPENGGVGTLTLGANEVVILASDATTFISENSSYDGTVIDTVMSLGNSGDTLKIIKNDGQVAFDVTYTNSGAQGDGNTLSWNGSSWVSSSPTPGVIASNSSQSSVNPTLPEAPKELVKPTQPEIVFGDIPTQIFSGLPYTISGIVYDTSRMPITSGWFVWSFGDGNIKTSIHPETFDYIYKYPGTYALTFSYFYNSFYPKPVVTKKMAVRVVLPDVTISKVYSDGSVEIKNEGENEINLARWKIKSSQKEFTFPDPTILLSGEQIVVPSTVTGFLKGTPKNSIALAMPNQEYVVTESTTKTSQPFVSEPKKDQVSSYNNALLASSGMINNEPDGSGDIEESSKNKWTYLFVVIVLIVFIWSVFFIKSKTPSIKGVDEAENFTISEIKDV